MFETIAGVLSLIFILFGMFFLGYVIFQKIMRGRKAKKVLTIMAGFSDDERLPEEVYSAYLSSNLLNFINKNEVIVIDFGVEQSVKDACKNIVGDEKNVFFCEKDNFEKIIEHLC